MALAPLTFRRATAIAVVVLLVLALLPAGWCVYARPVGAILDDAVSPVVYPLRVMGLHLRQTVSSPESSEADMALIDARLREQDNIIANQIGRIQELEDELHELRGQKQRLGGDSYNLARANVIGQSTDPVSTTLKLDKGSRDGLAVGQPVLYRASVVGRIIDVQSRVSTFELITRPGRVISAVITPRDVKGDWSALDRAPCQFRATRRERLVYDEADGSLPIHVKDFARLQDKDWPASVQHWIIGEVIDVKTSVDAPLRQRVVIEPLVRLRHLSAVSIVMPKQEADEPHAGGTP
ncbi:MAG: hypothetical protein CMJ49_11225 [Planctomycetaceae bacterium]|nr:hypothetical protein [Planctomycetaceae bacterium]